MTATAAAATGGGRCRSRCAHRSRCAELNHEIDHDVARLARDVVDGDLVAVTLLDLTEQRQGVVVIDEAHDLAIIERLERTKDCSMAEALGNAARIKGVNSILGHRDFFHRMGSGLILRPESQHPKLRVGVISIP